MKKLLVLPFVLIPGLSFADALPTIYCPASMSCQVNKKESTFRCYADDGDLSVFSIFSESPVQNGKFYFFGAGAGFSSFPTEENSIVCTYRLGEKNYKVLATLSNSIGTNIEPIYGAPSKWILNLNIGTSCNSSNPQDCPLKPANSMILYSDIGEHQGLNFYGNINDKCFLYNKNQTFLFVYNTECLKNTCGQNACTIKITAKDGSNNSYDLGSITFDPAHNFKILNITNNDAAPFKMSPFSYNSVGVFNKNIM